MSEPAASPGAPPPEGQPPRTPLDVLIERLALPAGWTGRSTHLVLLLAVSIACSFWISPGLYSQQIPSLGPQDVGKPFRSSSPSGFKAGRDYEVVHSAMTEQRREEARAAVLPVFDYDPSVQSGASKGLQDAFEQMQEIAAAARPLPAEVDPTVPPVAEAPPKKKRVEGVDPAKDKEEQELRAKLRGARREFDAALRGVEEEEFEALVAAHFSREVERALAALLETAYRSKVVSSRDELSRVDAHGITVRILGGTSEHRSATQQPLVNDVREAQAELDRFASIPGNLLPEAASSLRRAVLRVAKRQVRPNLSINIAETDARRRAAAMAVKEAVLEIKKGQKVIGDGELITDGHLVLINSMRAQTDQLDAVQLQLGGTGLVALLIAAAYVFHRNAFRRFRPTGKDLVLLGVLIVGALGLTHLWVTISDAVHDRYGQLPVEALYYFAPIAAGAMLVRFVLSEELALCFAIVLACLSGMMLGNSLTFGIYTLVGSLVAADRIPRAKDRVGIFRAGVATGVVQLCCVLAFALAEGKGLSGDALVSALFAGVGGALAVPVCVMAVTPLIEAGFGYASDIKLLELANLNHPALKELIVQAPGTYHHSIIIGSLVEGAAEAIGANPLLARSCAYYHDIGKGRNPLYFGENQKGDNRHDSLAPAMSAVIIKRHVTEGLEMARQYKLPQRVADAIPQHHGTRLVGFFFHKALKEQEGKENPQPIDESIYRYPGPKPQFREAALVMIADAVEAASRAMPEPSTAKFQALVQRLINLIFSEGQLDECELTLKDLHLISESFVRTLEGIYHARPTYPPGAVVAGVRPPSPPAPEAPKPPGLAVAKNPQDAKRSAGS